MNDEQVSRIVLAIRDHTRAMVAAMAYERESSIKARDDQRGRIGAAINQADALLAALSANSGGDGQSESQVANATPGREPGQGSKEAATPPLSADAAADAYGMNEHETVTVRRDDLRMLLDRHGSPRFPQAPGWLFRIKEAVSR